MTKFQFPADTPVCEKNVAKLQLKESKSVMLYVGKLILAMIFDISLKLK